MQVVQRCNHGLNSCTPAAGHVHIRLAKLSLGRPGALLLKTQNSAPISSNFAALGSFKACIRPTLAVPNATNGTQTIKKPNQQR